MSEKKQNYYEYLKINKNASIKEIKKACNLKIDILNRSNLSKEKKQEIFKVIQKIHDTLTDPYLRGRYDEKIKNLKKNESSLSLFNKNSFFDNFFDFNNSFDNMNTFFNDNKRNSNNSFSSSSVYSYSSINKNGIQHTKKKQLYKKMDNLLMNIMKNIMIKMERELI